MKLKHKNPAKTAMITFKVTPDEYDIIRQKADVYAGGNMSFWIRYAATKLRPRPRDLEEVNDD